jgi:hypothetical protein
MQAAIMNPLQQVQISPATAEDEGILWLML